MDERIAVDRVLIPVDGTDASLEAVEYALAVGDRYDAEVVVLYLLGSETRQAINAGEADTETIAAKTNAFLDRIRDRAAEQGVSMRATEASGFSTARKTHHPGNVVLDSADQIGGDFIVLPREPGEDVLGKAAGHVLAYADQPVLSV